LGLSGSSSGRRLTPLVAAGFLGVALLLLALTGLRLDARLALTFRTLGASFLIAAGGFITESLLAEARRSLLSRKSVPTLPESAATTRTLRSQLGAQLLRFRRLPVEIDWTGFWLPLLATLACNVAAAVVALRLWSASDPTALSAAEQQAIAGVLIALTFALLLLERVYAHSADQTSSPVLERLIRVPLLVSVGLGLAGIARSLGFEWPLFVDRALAVLLLAVAAEILLRSTTSLFLPTPLSGERGPVDSTIAGLIALRRPSFSATNAVLEKLTGIDLSRSWALAFLRRAALPVFAGMAVFAWLLTGVTAFGLDQRAVYEELGRPVSVMGPGLHVHLPWPFGITRNVELGVVHEIPIVFPADEGTAGGNSAPESIIEGHPGAEALPPRDADRLWDASHPSEASYLIASAANGGQSFQIVNIDLRIVFRTGLDDVAALKAAYRIAEPETLIRAESGRMLVRHFARYALLDVLGQNRAAFVAAFRSELQARLNALQTGVDVIAVIVEAIHPPPDAASAYHNVQAAQIDSIARISQSRGEAVRAEKSAEEEATKTRNVASADAAEQIYQAHTAKTLFDGDRQAYATGGHAFLLERWLGHLSKALALAPLVIVDHRMIGPNAPTVDLRHFGGTSPSASPTTNQE
jgi:regulator of protease activity HflC (stomatin/prohibitin superfamily)